MEKGKSKQWMRFAVVVMAVALCPPALALTTPEPQTKGISIQIAKSGQDEGAASLGDDLDNQIYLLKKVKEVAELRKAIQELKNPTPAFPLPMSGNSGFGSPVGMMTPPPAIQAPPAASAQPKQEMAAPAPKILSICGRKGDRAAVLRFAETGGTMTVRKGSSLPGGHQVVEISSTGVVVSGPGGLRDLMFDAEVTAIPAESDSASRSTGMVGGLAGMPMPPMGMPPMMGNQK